MADERGVTIKSLCGVYLGRISSASTRMMRRKVRQELKDPESLFERWKRNVDVPGGMVRTIRPSSRSPSRRNLRLLIRIYVNTKTFTTYDSGARDIGNVIEAIGNPF